MNAKLLDAAAKIIPSPQMLVNVVRLRVRQLVAGARPVVAAPPGMGAADIALLEIIDKKLTFAALPSRSAGHEVPVVLSFPGLSSTKKAA